MNEETRIPAEEAEHPPGDLITPENIPTPDDREVRHRAPMQARHRWALAGLLLATAVLYIGRLSAPGRELATNDEQCRKYPVLAGARCYVMIPLDEVHYVPDARDVIRFGTESDTRVPTDDDGSFVVHPPAGKWFIALGMKLFGDRPFGWRFFGAVFGVLGVAIMFGLGWRLFRTPGWGLLAATLLAIDGLWFVQSRVAMLDIYAAVFTLAGIWFVLEDRARNHRGWRLAAATAFGFALATKWSAIPYVAIGIAIGVATAVQRARASAPPPPIEDLVSAAPPRTRPRLLRPIARALLTFVALPYALYVASYTPWLLDSHRYDPPLCEEITVPEDAGAVTRVTKRLQANTGRFGQWTCYQMEMLSFHRRLEKYKAPEIEDGATPKPTATPDHLVPAHPYFGHGSTWPWIGRPVAHAYETRGKDKDERAYEVLGAPNPVVWVAAFFVGIPTLLVMAIRRRDTSAMLLLVFIAAGWGPYVLADFVARPVFLFYATPLVPFLVLSVVHLLQRGRARRPWTSRAIVAFTLLAVLAFGYLYPVLASAPLPLPAWRHRMLLQSDCSVPDRIKIACWI